MAYKSGIGQKFYRIGRPKVTDIDYNTVAPYYNLAIIHVVICVFLNDFVARKYFGCYTLVN